MSDTQHFPSPRDGVPLQLKVNLYIRHASLEPHRTVSSELNNVQNNTGSNSQSSCCKQLGVVHFTSMSSSMMYRERNCSNGASVRRE